MEIEINDEDKVRVKLNAVVVDGMEIIPESYFYGYKHRKILDKLVALLENN